MINLEDDFLEKHAQVRIDNGEVVAVGYFPTAPQDENIKVVDLTDEQREAIREPGISVLNKDGSITTTFVAPEEIEQPVYGDDADMDNVGIIQAASNLRLYVAANEPSNEYTATTVRLICLVLLYLMKRWIRLT